ncbi:hypothetical protein ISCGN_032953 [Ixodes scapularis]
MRTKRLSNFVVVRTCSAHRADDTARLRPGDMLKTTARRERRGRPKNGTAACVRPAVSKADGRSFQGFQSAHPHAGCVMLTFVHDGGTSDRHSTKAKHEAIHWPQTTTTPRKRRARYAADTVAAEEGPHSHTHGAHSSASSAAARN